MRDALTLTCAVTLLFFLMSAPALCMYLAGLNLWRLGVRSGTMEVCYCDGLFSACLMLADLAAVLLLERRFQLAHDAGSSVGGAVLASLLRAIT